MASDLNTEVENRISSDKNIQNQIDVIKSGQLGSIKPTDAAPTPARNGNYTFSIGGNKPAWLTAEAGVTEVKAMDGVAVVYTEPSSYTYTHVDVNGDFALKSDQINAFTDNIVANKFIKELYLYSNNNVNISDLIQSGLVKINNIYIKNTGNSTGVNLNVGTNSVSFSGDVLSGDASILPLTGLIAGVFGYIILNLNAIPKDTTHTLNAIVNANALSLDFNPRISEFIKETDAIEELFIFGDISDANNLIVGKVPQTIQLSSSSSSEIIIVNTTVGSSSFTDYAKISKFLGNYEDHKIMPVQKGATLIGFCVINWNILSKIATPANQFRCYRAITSKNRNIDNFPKIRSYINEIYTESVNSISSKGYIVEPRISAILNGQAKTIMTVLGAYYNRDGYVINRIPVTIGKQYAVVGEVRTGQEDVSVCGFYSDIAFSNPSGLVVQEANKTVRYSSIFTATNSYIYVANTLYVHEVKSNVFVETQQITVDNSVIQNSQNPPKGGAVFSSILALQNQISSISETGVVTKTSTIVIAASNSSNSAKLAANYVCTGENDDVLINQAIQELPDFGGEIHFSSGLFSISSPIVIDRMIKITGEGHGIAGIPAYAQTNGIVYNSRTLAQNMYGRELGVTTLRASVDTEVIKIGSSTSQKLQIILRDFLIQGFGKDRSTKAGIVAICDTDISVLQNIGVCDAMVGAYLWGNSYMDAMCILNCSFQQCGCGLILRGAWSKVVECCIADNNSITTFNGLNVYSGGIYVTGSNNTISGGEIVRPDKYTPTSQGYAVVIAGGYCKIVNLSINTCYGGGVVVSEFGCSIKGCSILNYGIDGMTGYVAGINVKNNLTVISENRIGKSTLGSLGNATYGIFSSLSLSWQKIAMLNNTFQYCTTPILTSSLGSHITEVNSVVWND